MKIPRPYRYNEYGLKHMSISWDTPARIIVLLLILSIPLAFLGYDDRHIATPSVHFTLTNDMRSGSNLSEPSAQVSQGGPGIAITFNGWSVDNWYGIRSLLNTYNAKATFFVGNLGYLTNDDFDKLRTLKSDGHEIASQGLHFFDAEDYINNYSLQAYIDDEITPALEILSENELIPSSFAYPFGSRNSLLDAELLRHFTRLRATAYSTTTTRVVDLDPVYYTWQNESLIRGVGIDAEYDNPIEDIIEGMERAHQYNEVLVSYTHTLTEDILNYGTPVEKMEAILEAAQTLNLGFYTVSGLSNPTTLIPPTTPTESGLPFDLVVSIVISGVGILLLWVLVSYIFRDDKWQSG